MLIVFILLLTILSIALNLASLSIISVKKIAERQEIIRMKQERVSENDKSNLGRIAKNAIYRSTIGTLLMFKLIVDCIRNILLIILPVIAIIDVIVFIILVTTSNSVLTLF